MNETAGTDDLSAADAVATIERVSTYEEPLRRRTEGVTWVVWGLVTVTFLATQAALGDTVPWELYFLIWLPGWLGVGVLGAELVWRIAGLTRETLAPDARRAIALFVVGALAFASLMAAVYPFSGPNYAPQTILVLVLPWTFLATVQWGRLTEGGRRLSVAVAVTLVVLGAAFLLAGGVAFVQGTDRAALMVGMIAGGVPFATGTWWTLRG